MTMISWILSIGISLAGKSAAPINHLGFKETRLTIHETGCVYRSLHDLIRNVHRNVDRNVHGYIFSQRKYVNIALSPKLRFVNSLGCRDGDPIHIVLLLFAINSCPSSFLAGQGKVDDMTLQKIILTFCNIYGLTIF